MQNLQSRYALLTLRERQVKALVASGLLNKQVGGELGISEITVKFHRGNLMRRMKADSFAELVNMAARLSHNTGSSYSEAFRQSGISACQKRGHRNNKRCAYVRVGDDSSGY